jgi:hypothetical protein
MIVSFNGRIILKQYIHKKRKRFGIKVYKLADRNGYTYNMKVYLGQDKKNSNAGKSSAHNTVTELVHCVQRKDINYSWIIFFLHPLSLQSFIKITKLIVVGLYVPSKKGCPKNLNSSQMKKRRS